MLIQVVDDHLRQRIPLDLDDDTCVLVRLIAHRRDVCDDLLVYKVGNPLHQHGAVDVERNLGDNNLLAAAFKLLEADLAPHFHAAASGGEILLHSLQPADHAAGREVRPFDMLHQLLERDLWTVDLRTDAVDDLAQVMRRHIRGHADGDAGAAVDQQVWERGGEDCRLGAGLVVVGNEIHRLLVHVLHDYRAERRQPGFSVPH